MSLKDPASFFDRVRPHFWIGFWLRAGETSEAAWRSDQRIGLIGGS